MSRRRPSRVTIAASALGCALALAGCGGDEGSPQDGTTTAGTTTSAAPSEPTTSATATLAPTKAAPALPRCADVWVEGRRLPKPYRGCLEEDGRVSKSVKSCSIGATLAQYGERFYGIAGRPVVRAEPTRNQNQAYLDLLTTCTG